MGGGPDATTSKTPGGVKPRPGGSPTWPQPLKMYLLLARAPCAPLPGRLRAWAGVAPPRPWLGFPSRRWEGAARKPHSMVTECPLREPRGAGICGKHGNCVPSSRPSLEGLTGPRVSRDSAPPLPRARGALCFARAARRGPSLGQPGTTGQSVAPGPPGTPRMPKKGHSLCNARALSSNIGPASFPGHVSAPLREGRGLPSEALVAGSCGWAWTPGGSTSTPAPAAATLPLTRPPPLPRSPGADSGGGAGSHRV